MFTGTLALLDFGIEADRVHFNVMILGMLFLLVGNGVGKVLLPTRKLGAKWVSRETNQVESGIVYRYLVYGMIFFSIFICILYYRAIGYNMIVLGMVNMLSGSGPIEDAATLRLQTYDSSGSYFAPGYVNQFKNILLPLLIGYTWAKYIIIGKKSWIFQFFLIFISLLSVIFLLGTGQRAPFVKAYLMVLFFLYTILSNKRIKFRIIATNVLIILTLFGFMSVIIGRTAVGESDTNVVVDVLSTLHRRVTQANQSSGVIGFRYIYNKPNQWGAEWATSFLGILPSHTGSTLSREIARLIWGDRGTAPISIWGSIYHNFGFFGVVVVPFLMGLTHQYLYFRLLSKPRTIIIRTLIYSGVFFIFGSWAVGPPMYMINLGLLALIVLRYLFIFLHNMLGKKVILLHE